MTGILSFVRLMRKAEKKSCFLWMGTCRDGIKNTFCWKNRYVFGMDDDFAYVGSLNYDEGKAESQEAEVNDFIYERIALDTGEAETLFIQHGVEGMHSYYVWNSYRPEIHQGYIYYADW